MHQLVPLIVHVTERRRDEEGKLLHRDHSIARSRPAKHASPAPSEPSRETISAAGCPGSRWRASGSLPMAWVCLRTPTAVSMVMRSARNAQRGQRQALSNSSPLERGFTSRRSERRTVQSTPHVNVQTRLHPDTRCSEYFTKVVRMNHKRRVMSDRANATSTYGSLSVLSRGSQTVRSATDARNQLTLCLSGVRLWTMWAWMFLARCRDSTQSPCPHACCAHRHAMATTERGSLAAAAAGGSACVICGEVGRFAEYPPWRVALWCPRRYRHRSGSARTLVP